jgi:hypothetical protein
MIIPAGYLNLSHIGPIVAEAAQHLGPEVVHVAYRLRPDSTGEPSIYFRILIDDRYFSEDTIARLTNRISTALRDAVRPLEDWGLRPYFNYKTKSDHDRRPNPDWM